MGEGGGACHTCTCVYHADHTIAILSNEVWCCCDWGCDYPNHAAHIVIHPEAINGEVGGTTTFLSCVAFGHPFPEITWTRLGNNFTNMSAFTVSQTLITVNQVTLAKSTLKVCRIQEVEPSLFTCTANTGYGSDSIDFEIDVHSIGGMLLVSLE